MTWEQRMEILLREVIRSMQEKLAARLPDTHRFPPIGCGMRIPDTEFIAYLLVGCDEQNQHGRRIRLRVLKEGTDRAFEQIFPEMTSAEIRAWFADPGADTGIRQTLEELLARARAE